MQKINSATDLRNAIIQLEIEHAEEGKLLKQQFHIAYERIKPLNLIKRTLREAIGSQELKASVAETSVGLAAGYLSRLLFVNVSHNRLRNVLGIALQSGIAHLVARNPERVQSIGIGVFSILKHVLKKRVPVSKNGDAA